MATRGEHVEVMHQLLDIFMRDQQVNRDHISVQIDHAVSVHSNNVQTQELSEQIEQFLINLSVCYQLYGCPTHIIEINMAKVARGLGMEVDFAIFPSYSLISVTKSEYGKLRKHTMYFTTSTGIDMYKLQMTDELVRRVQSYSSAEPPKSVTTDAAAQIVDQIANELLLLALFSASPNEAFSTIVIPMAVGVYNLNAPQSMLQFRYAQNLQACIHWWRTITR